MMRIDLTPEEITAHVASVLQKLEQEADKHFRNGDFTIRDLVPSDMPGLSNNEWTETSGGSDNAYATTTMGDGTAIADDTLIALWGLQIITPHTLPPVTVFRITVGAALRSQFSLYPIIPIINSGTAVGDQFNPKIGYLMTPLIITANKTLKIEEYVVTTSTAYTPVFHGAVAEPNGKLIEA
jgi:hypothetical protein